MRLLFLKYYKAIMVTMVLSIMLLVPIFAISTASAAGSLAGEIDANLQATTLNTELGTAGSEDLPRTIGRIIVTILGFLGIIFIVLIIWAGFKWLLAQGDEGKIKKAKEMIIQSVIAVVIIFLAYAITTFIFDTVIGEGIMGQTN